MAITSPYNQYKQASAETASPTRLVVMLFDGAIRFLNQALPAMEAKDLELQSLTIGKAQAILAHLRATLNFEAAPGICADLDLTYGLFYDTLTQANRYDDTARLNQVIAGLRELREAWVLVDREIQSSKATAQADAGRDLIAA